MNINRSAIRKAAPRARAALILVAAIATLALPQSGGSAARTSAVGGAQAGSAGAAQRTVKDPPLLDLAGYNAILAKNKGKPLLVNFWATWCEPCRFEYPMLVELAKQYKPQGLTVIGVSFDDDADMNLVRHFLAKHNPDFPNYRQKPGIDIHEFTHGVNPEWTGTLPATVFYGRDGRLLGEFIGTRPREEFEAAIRAALGSPGRDAAPPGAHSP